MAEQQTTEPIGTGSSGSRVDADAIIPASVDPEEYQHLLEDYSHLAPPSRDELIEGRVLKISASQEIGRAHV